MSELNVLCIRLQDYENYESKLQNAFDKVSDKTLIVRHTGRTSRNPHFHIIIHTTAKPDSFRVYLKRIFTEGTGNKHLSVKQCKNKETKEVAKIGDETYKKAHSYLFHESEDCIVYNNNYTEDELQDYRKLNRDIKQAISDNTTDIICSRIVSQFLSSNRIPTHRAVAEAIYRDCNLEPDPKKRYYPATRMHLDRRVFKIQGEIANYHDSRTGSTRFSDIAFNLWYEKLS